MISTYPNTDKDGSLYATEGDAENAKIKVELYAFDSNPIFKDTDFDGIDDGAGKSKLKEIERQYGLTEENEDDLTERYLHCKSIPHSTLEALRKDNRAKDNHFTGRMNSTRLSGLSGLEVDMNMDYRYFFLSNKLYYDELSTMSLLYANSIYKEGPTKHSGIVIKDMQNVYTESSTNVSTNSEVEHMIVDGIEYKNLRVKDLMEFYGFKDVRTYYMGSPGDEGDENKEHFNAFMQNINGSSELHIPESEIDTDYKARIWSNGMIRIGTKYKNVDEIYLGYKDTHKGRVAIGHKTIQYHNRYKTVIGIVIRGTAEDDDWDSDFDMGDIDLKNAISTNTDANSGYANYKINSDGISHNSEEIDIFLNNPQHNTKYDHQYNRELSHFAYGYPDWLNTQHHAGFDKVEAELLHS